MNFYNHNRPITLYRLVFRSSSRVLNSSNKCYSPTNPTVYYNNSRNSTSVHNPRSAGINYSLFPSSISSLHTMSSSALAQNVIDKNAQEAAGSEPVTRSSTPVSNYNSSDYYISRPSSRSNMREKVYHKVFRVAVIGSGNWGTTVAKIVAENTKEHPELFEEQVRMWVYEENVNGKKLTDIINSQHENVRYLPDVKLPHNLIADPDLKHTIEGADLVVFNIPHQFLPNICKQIDGIDFSKVRAVSCLKGIHIGKEGVSLLSTYIEETLGLHCGVLSGANLAPEVAREKFSETTVAYPLPSNYFEGDIDEDLLKILFQRSYFHVRVSPDTAGVSIGGALKNVIAIGAGLVEGIGWGDNAKSAIMRRGLMEMVRFGIMFFPDCRPETFTVESSGVADLITSCASGRNVRVGRETARTGRRVTDVEKDILNGQSAQGIETMKEVHAFLSERNMTADFPLMEAIYQICFGDLHITELPELLAASD